MVCMMGGCASHEEEEVVVGEEEKVGVDGGVEAIGSALRHSAIWMRVLLGGGSTRAAGRRGGGAAEGRGTER